MPGALVQQTAVCYLSTIPQAAHVFKVFQARAIPIMSDTDVELSGLYYYNTGIDESVWDA